MAITDEEEKALLAELESLGDTEVRRRVAKSIYGNQTTKRRIVDDWLAQGERERTFSSQDEQIDIARAARDAAWSAAEAARDAAAEARAQSLIAQRANTRATIGIVIAIVSAVASAVIAFYRP